MRTFEFIDLNEMKAKARTGNLQQEILYCLQDEETFWERVFDQDNIYDYFDAQFDNFDLTEREIRNPDVIINAFLYKEEAEKKEAAVFLHDLIDLMYEQFKNLYPRDKEELKMWIMMSSTIRHEGLTNVREYCDQELDKLNR